jgi:hypothetical protein
MANPVKGCRDCLASRTKREWGVLWSAYLLFWLVLTAIFVIHLEVMRSVLPPGIIAFGPNRGEIKGNADDVELCPFPNDRAHATCNRFVHGAHFAIAKANVNDMQFNSQKQDLALANVPLPGQEISPTPWIKDDSDVCGADGTTSCLSSYSASERTSGVPEIFPGDQFEQSQQIRMLAQWDTRNLAGAVEVRCFDSSVDGAALVETDFPKTYSAPVFSGCVDPYEPHRNGTDVGKHTCEVIDGELRVTWPQDYHAPQILQYKVAPNITATTTDGAAVRVICTTMGPLENEDYAQVPWLRNSDTQAIEVEYEFVWRPISA